MEKGKYVLVNDVRLYYEIYGQGEPLVLIHGLGSSTRDWECQIPLFSKHYQVIVFDLRGHGKSDKPNHSYTVKLFAEDTAQFLNKLLNQQSAHILGHSLGGMVAFQLVLDHPELVKSLTIVNSAPLVSFFGLKNTIKFYLREASVKLFGMHYLSASLAKLVFPKPEQAKIREIFIERWRENDPQAYLNSLHAFRNWNVMKRLKEIQCPTLIIAADHDYTPVSFKTFYTKLIPQAKLKIIQDSYHVSIIDQAEILNQIVLHFLNERVNTSVTTLKN